MKGNIEELITIPIKYVKQNKERIVLLEFQGSLSISKMNTETGEIANSENINDFDNTVIGQLINFDNISKNLNSPIELKIGYHTLIGKVSFYFY